MINLENVSFYYKPNKEILKNINLTIKPGEFVAIIGCNASGKSTLAKHMNGLLLPTSGDVYIFDRNTKIQKYSLSIKQDVAMVFQNPDNQLVASVVEDDVAFALENLAISFEEMHERTKETLKEVGMYEYREYSPAMLSGGQKQKIAIAGAIVVEPKFLVLDEPTSMLDPQSRKDVYAILKKLNKKKNVGIVLITQFMQEAVHAQRIIVMHQGEVVMDGTPESVFENIEFLESIKLKAPQITQFCFELNRLGEQIQPTIFEPEKCAAELFKALTR